ncbi:MAG TPA: alpha/beta hydrolase [Longimicrobiaceae bacterium]|nr:alpha/beta hydrolase [Longimicrobiaceae bacterium]
MPEWRDTPSLPDRLRGALACRLGRLPGHLLVRLSRRPPVRIDGQTLDPVLQLLLSMRPQGGPAPLTAGSPAEARRRFRREGLSVRGRATPVGAVRDLMVAGGAGPIRARHYAPASSGGTASAPPLLVYYHGGGFMLGDLDTHDEVCRLLCRHGRQQVLSVEYRLAPEHPFPAAVEDAEAAFRWAQAHAAELGADPERVAVGGDSAGANLAAVVAQRTTHTRPPAAQLLLYPPMDRVTVRRSHRLFDQGFFLSLADREAFSAHYFGATSAGEENPGTSPLLTADLSALAPAFVVTAGFDVLRDEGEAYARALSEAGTSCVLHREVTLTHGFVQLTGVCPAAHRATVALARRWRSLLDAIPQPS